MTVKHITDSGARRMFLFLLVLTIASTLGLQGWRTLINNFSVEVGHLSGFDMGLVQSCREIPGFLSLLVVYLLLFISEHRLGACSVLVMGLGISMTGFLPTTSGIILTTMIMSFGFHYYETVNQSLTLQYFDHATAPLIFGRCANQEAYVIISDSAHGDTVDFHVDVEASPKKGLTRIESFHVRQYLTIPLKDVSLLNSNH